MLCCVRVLVGLSPHSSKVEVEVDGRGVSDVQDAVGLGREPGHYLTSSRERTRRGAVRQSTGGGGTGETAHLASGSLQVLP